MIVRAVVTLATGLFLIWVGIMVWVSYIGSPWFILGLLLVLLGGGIVLSLIGGPLGMGWYGG